MQPPPPGHHVAMPNQSADPPGAASPGKRWLARLSFALAFLAVAVVVAFAEWWSLAMFAVGAAAAAVSLTAAFFVLSRRGVLRWLALAVFVATPVAVLVIYALADLLWMAAVAAAAWLLAGVTGRAALAVDKAEWRMPELGGGPGPAPVPDHEPAIRRREGGQVRPATQGGGARRGGVPDERPRPGRRGRGRPAGGRGRRRPARRRGRRRHPGAGGGRRRRARHPVPGDHRGHPQPLRA